ncbi:glycosyltransferase family 4 protein [Listeria aquatica]|uniref:Glycosyltransferase family 4 protein n=1 Tax=Listeria aquatica TaxID=1494960 RepID=A0A841ZM08_9LIST|nr:glycosyltransferase family 4 protein [Listeria aquatica]MBC1521316.1 glycosyltransferase family 4 protein [Listeria aquatica]
MKKKVLVITQNFAPEIGSAANRMERICEILNEAEAVTVFTTEPQYPQRAIYSKDKFRTSSSSTGFIIKRVKTRRYATEKNLFFRFLLYLEVFIKLLLAIRREKQNFDIVLATTPPLSIPLVALFAKRKFKAELVLDVRDLWPESMQIFNHFIATIARRSSYWIERVIYQKADRIIVNSEGFIPFIREKVGESKEILFSPNALMPKEFYSKRIFNTKEFFKIVYVGNMGAAQDLDSFILLAKSLQDHPHIRFQMIGYGADYARIRKRINDERLWNIEIRSPEPRQKIIEHLKSADIAYVGLENIPILHTVIPGKIIDYMGSALPIIGIASGYSKKIIEQARAGIVFEEKQIMAIKKVLLEWASHPEIRFYHGENGRAYAEKHFSWELNQSLLNKFVVGDDDEEKSHDVCLERVYK